MSEWGNPLDILLLLLRNMRSAPALGRLGELREVVINGINQVLIT